MRQVPMERSRKQLVQMQPVRTLLRRRLVLQVRRQQVRRRTRQERMLPERMRLGQSRCCRESTRPVQMRQAQEQKQQALLLLFCRRQPVRQPAGMRSTTSFS